MTMKKVFLLSLATLALFVASFVFSHHLNHAASIACMALAMFSLLPIAAMWDKQESERNR